MACLTAAFRKLMWHGSQCFLLPWTAMSRLSQFGLQHVSLCPNGRPLFALISSHPRSAEKGAEGVGVAGSQPHTKGVDEGVEQKRIKGHRYPAGGRSK